MFLANIYRFSFLVVVNTVKNTVLRIALGYT